MLEKYCWMEQTDFEHYQVLEIVNGGRISVTDAISQETSRVKL